MPQDSFFDGCANSRPAELLARFLGPLKASVDTLADQSLVDVAKEIQQ
jgi:hypothetical protein